MYYGITGMVELVLHDLPLLTQMENTGGSLSFILITDPTLSNQTLSVLCLRWLLTSHLILQKRHDAAHFSKSESLSTMWNFGAQKFNF